MKKIKFLILSLSLLLFSFADAQIIDPSDIKNKTEDKIILTLNINKTEFLINNELLLFGQINIKNNSHNTIIFPKTFDLDFTIRESKKKLLIKSKYVIDEHVNLIQNNRRTKIKPNKSADFQFSEDGLSDYNLKESQEYFLRFSLNTEKFKRLEDSTTYYSNFCKFILQAK